MIKPTPFEKIDKKLYGDVNGMYLFCYHNPISGWGDLP